MAGHHGGSRAPWHQTLHVVDKQNHLLTLETPRYSWNVHFISYHLTVGRESRTLCHKVSCTLQRNSLQVSKGCECSKEEKNVPLLRPQSLQNGDTFFPYLLFLKPGLGLTLILGSLMNIWIFIWSKPVNVKLLKGLLKMNFYPSFWPKLLEKLPAVIRFIQTHKILIMFKAISVSHKGYYFSPL